ncbi:MAG: putative rane protein [Gammaproteobacteria bacterium]|nr:putative rane protein [Gammaproteobacteria bacterium]
MILLETSVSLFFLGFVTSFVGTNTGGSSLITIPAMIAMGLPSAAAIASARMTAIGTSIAGLRQFHKKGKVDYNTAWPAAILSVIGAGVGALVLTHMPEALLIKIIGVLTLVLLATSYIIKTHLKLGPEPTRTKKMVGYSLFLFTSILGGFYGGQGILTTYIFVIFFHKTLSESAGTRKITALATAIAAALIFGFHNLINWWAVAALMAGTVIGSSLGAAYALKKGDAWLEKIFNIVAVLLAVKLLLSSF